MCGLHRDLSRDDWIYKMEKKFRAVFGSQGSTEKKYPTAISKQLFEVVFSTFCEQKTFLNSFENILASALKGYII